jgi:hypothetical protein
MNRIYRIRLAAFAMLVMAMPLLIAVAQAKPGGGEP